MSAEGIIVTGYERTPKKLIERFKNKAVANLDDCLGRNRAFDSRIRPISGGNILGCAFTVKVPAGDNLMLHKAMDLAQEGDVIVIDAEGFCDRAIFGELMVSYCISRKLGGIIVDGSIRDYEVLSKLDFPIYAKGVSPNGPYKNGPGEIGTIISCGGQIVQPGDIIIGDQDGIIALRQEEAEKLIEDVEQIEIKENAILETIKVHGTYNRSWVDEILNEIGCIYKKI